MIYYEPPEDANSEDELVEDILPAIMAMLDAENMPKNEGGICNKDTLRILSELAERKRSRIKSLEMMIEKACAIKNLHQIMFNSLEQHSEI